MLVATPEIPVPMPYGVLMEIILRVVVRKLWERISRGAKVVAQIKPSVVEKASRFLSSDLKT